MAGALIWVKGCWRRGRAGLVGVILLCAVAGAVVLTVTAGARRSSTSLDRLAEATASADVLLDVTGVDPSAMNAVAASPMVVAAGELSIVYAVVDGVDEDLGLFIPNDDLMGGLERARVLRGRLPTSTNADEVAVNEFAARLIGVDVGDGITISTLTPDQVAAEEYYPALGPVLHVRVVGVTRGPDDLVTDGEATITTSPALMSVLAGRADVFATYLGVRLAPGASAADLEESLDPQLSGGLRNASVTFEMRTKSVRDAISTIAAGLLVFAIVSAVASVVVVGLAVGRHLAGTTGDQDVLAAIGMSPASRRLGLVLTAAPIAAGGAALAVVGSVLASPLMPIGLARKAEPDPGLAIDWWVVSIGFLTVALLVLATAALSAWRIVRASGASGELAQPSRLRSAATHSGAGPTIATGVELAFDRRRPAIPSRSAIAGVTVAVIAVVAIFTFSASLDRLLASPTRWGYPWEVKLDFTSSDVEDAATELSADSRFADVARWDAGFSYVDGTPIRAFGLTPLRGRLGYALRSGRQPAATDEVVLGSTTAGTLHVSVGDDVAVAADASSQTVPVHVVGIALFPEVDEGDLTNGIGYFGTGFGSNASTPDLFEASQVVLSGSSGVDRDELVTELADEFGDIVSDASAASAPGGVANLTGVRSLPRAIAIFVVVLGLASLAHALATTVTRRRHELATLRSIGLTPRQTTACVVWQSLTIAAVALVVGIPLGLIVGRGAWWAAADPIGVRTDISRPFGALALVCAGTIVAGAVLAAVVAWPAGRTAPARALRTE